MLFKSKTSVSAAAVILALGAQACAPAESNPESPTITIEVEIFSSPSPNPDSLPKERSPSIEEQDRLTEHALTPVPSPATPLPPPPRAVPSSSPTPAPRTRRLPSPLPAHQTVLQFNESQPTHELEDRVAQIKNNTRTTFLQIEALLQKKAQKSAQSLFERNSQGLALSASEQGCLKTYEKFYARHDIEIRIALGYDDIDESDETHDLSNALALQDLLTRPCAQAQGSPLSPLCGFTFGSSSNELVKTVAGPDSLPRTVHIWIQNSSATASDSLNRGALSHEQALRTKKAETFFFEGLRQAEAVFYLGHSRDGGGPSFGPPRRIQDRPAFTCPTSLPVDQLQKCKKMGAEVDYSWYQRHPVNAFRMYQTLASTDPLNRTQFVSLASCYSSRHFSKGVLSSAPEVAFLGTQHLLSNDGMRAFVVAGLHNLLSFTCKSEFISSWVRPELIWSSTEKKERQDGNPILKGFF